MGDSKILEVAVDGGAIYGYTGINFKNVEDGKTEDELAVKLRDCLKSKQSSEGGRRRKRKTKVKSKKRANRRRRTRYQH